MRLLGLIISNACEIMIRNKMRRRVRSVVPSISKAEVNVRLLPGFDSEESSSPGRRVKICDRNAETKTDWRNNKCPPSTDSTVGKENAGKQSYEKEKEKQEFSYDLV